jgi:hypothetical protein
MSRFSNLHYITYLFVALLIVSCSQTDNKYTIAENAQLSTDITPEDIRTHIGYLAQASLGGREAGTAGEAMAARYIADYFRQFGMQPAGDDSTWYQQFTVNKSVMNNPHQTDSTNFPDKERIARNVAGIIKGSEQPDSYIVIGAHYDHLGMGTFGSLYNRGTSQIHNGADDNASGTSGLLELAQYFSEHQPQKSLLFVAFSAEEMGLLGSQYFVEHSPVPLDHMQAMINMDMIGRLAENKLIIFGTGTADGWQDLISRANSDSLDIKTIPDGAGASDHTSFYNKEIPVLHYFTDTHADYHRPSDDTEFINAEGQDLVLEHLKRLIAEIDTLSENQLAYTNAPVTQQQNMVLKGPTLGVTPDYGFEGKGMRITGVRAGGPADKAGLQNGDIIIGVDGQSLKDIYEYMEVLNTLEIGQQTTVTISRSSTERTVPVTF